MNILNFNHQTRVKKLIFKPIILVTTVVFVCLISSLSYSQNCPTAPTISANQNDFCVEGTAQISTQTSQTTAYYSLHNASNNMQIGNATLGTGNALNFSTGNISSTSSFYVKATTVNNALQFDGSTSYVSLNGGNSLSGLPAANGTLEAWIKTGNAGTGLRAIVIFRNGYGLWLNDNKLFTYNGSEFTATDTLNNNQWHHVAFVFQSGVANGSKLYVNGLPVLTFTFTVSPSAYSGAHSTIGNLLNSAGGQTFNGQIDEIRVWSVAKTDAQILSDYQLVLNGNETNLVAYYNFDEGTGTTLNDLTSNNNNGTISNATWVFNSNAGAAICSENSNTNVTITINTNPQTSVSVTDESCSNQNNGAIDLTVTGGQSPYTYTWSDAGNSTTQDLTSLGAGSYSVTVTDDNNCTVSTTAQVNVSTVISNQANVTDPTCAGNNNGQINNSTLGGASPYTYTWSNGLTGNQNKGLLPGNYYITVTDNSNCQIIDTVTVSSPSMACAGSNGPCADLFFSEYIEGSSNNKALEIYNPTGDTINFSGYKVLLFTNGNSSPGSTLNLTGSIIPNSTYTIVHTSANNDFKAIANLQSGGVTGFNGDDAVVLLNPSNDTLDIIGVVGTDPGTNWPIIGTNSVNGTTVDRTLVRNANVRQGQKRWSTGSVTEWEVYAQDNISNLGSHTSSLCPNVSVTGVVQHVACYNQSNGSIDITVSNGVAPYTYSWSNAEITEDISNLAAGTYTVTITDAMNGTTSQSFTVNEPTQISATATPTHILCNGNSNGEIDLSVSGGVEPYTFVWSNNETTEDLSNLSAANYEVTITDANYCTAIQSAIVNMPSQINIASQITQVTCINGADGAIDLTITGGESPYTFVWNDANSSTTEDLTGLAAGTYSISVTDANSCTTNQTLQVNDGHEITASISTGNSTCNTADGSATINVTSSGTYSFVWNDLSSQTTSTATGLTAGNYEVTVTHTESGCTQQFNTTVSDNAGPTATSVITNVNCFGNSTGAININVTGGNGNLTFSWDDISNSTTEDLSNIPAGTYTVTITDQLNCQTTETVTITEPSSAILVNQSITHVNCFNAANGAVDVTVTGGTPNYTFAWDDALNSTTEDLPSLSGGTYNLTVTDANNCTATTSATVNEPTALIASVNLDHAITCRTADDGEISVSVSGGTPSYDYLWNDNITTGSRTTLAPGQYLVTVTDANNCTATADITLSEPHGTSISPTINQITCYNGTNGSIHLNAVSPLGAVTYNWSNNATTDLNDNLPAGTYSVTVTDLNNCMETESLTLTNPNPIDSNIFDTIFIGQSITFNNQTYNATGVYSSVYQAANGCDSTVYFNLTVALPSTPVIISQYIETNSGTTPKGIEIWNVSGADLDLSVYPIEILQRTNNNNLISIKTINTGTFDAGDVMVIGTTDIGTYLTTANLTYIRFELQSFTFNGDDALAIKVNGEFSDIFGSPDQNPVSIWSGNGVSTANQNIALKKGITTGDIDGWTDPSLRFINVAIGNQLDGFGIPPVPCKNDTTEITEIICFGESFSFKQQQLTAAGTYLDTLAKNDGCTTDSIIILNLQINPQIITGTTTTDVSCNGGTDGSIDLTVSGGSGTFTYLWDDANNSITEDLSGLAIGTYEVTVTDNLNCSATANTTINQPAVLSASALATNVTCFNGSDGSIDVSVTGGSSGFTFVWDDINNSATEDLTGVSAGTYTATVTDAKGCTTTASATILNGDEITATTSSTNSSCNLSDGSVTINVTSSGTYSYVWSDALSQAAPSAVNLPSGTYTVTVTNVNNNCSAVFTQTVSDNAAPSASAIASDVSCFGGNNGTIDLTVTGGSQPYVYSWSNNESTEDIFTLSAGTYDVTVVDANNCQALTSATVNEPSELLATASTQDVTCFNGNDGVLSIVASGGTEPYDYLWSSVGQGSSSLVSAGNYSITITDANNCIYILGASVGQPTQLVATALVGNAFCYGQNGTIDLSTSGGIAPYTYNWSNTAQDTLISAPAGSYSVTITDANNCEIILNETISEPAELIASTSVVPISCFGGLADVTILPTGGTGNYSYAWSASGSGNNALVAAGNYDITVTDANNCSFTLNEIITQPAQIDTVLFDTITLGDTLIFNGQPIYAAGTYQTSLTASNNCDSVVYLDVQIIVPPLTGTPIIISQYVETSSGTTPKGVELWNVSGQTIDLAYYPVEILKGNNGGALQNDITINSGILNNGEVMIVGTTDMGTYLTNQGLTHVLFVEKGFTFNGDDALELKVGGITTDIFGTPGVDPGTAWTGNGVSTANQNIDLKPGILTGDTAGWNDPSVRFFTQTIDNSLTGFGLPPEQCQPKFSIDTIETCSSYTWIDGNTYTSNNNSATFTLQNNQGCDSVITLNLTINQFIYGNQSLSFCTGKSITFLGKTYNQAGFFNDTILSQNGCDSIVLIELEEIANPIIKIDTLNNPWCNKVSYSISTQDTGLSFTWLNGQTGSIIHVGLNNGFYQEISAVATNNYGCQSDTARAFFNGSSALESFTILANSYVRMIADNKIENGALGVRATNGLIHIDNYSGPVGLNGFIQADSVFKRNHTIFDSIIKQPVAVNLPNHNTSTVIPLNFNIVYAQPGATKTVNHRNVHVVAYKNSTVYLNNNRYGDITVHRGATVIFTNPNVEITNLFLLDAATKSNAATVKFTQPTMLRVRNQVDLGKRASLNPDSLAVTIYIGGGTHIKQFIVEPKGVTSNANVFILNGKIVIEDILLPTMTKLTGRFIADSVFAQSRRVRWNWSECLEQESVNPPIAQKRDSQESISNAEVDDRPIQQIVNGKAILQLVPNPFIEQFRLSYSNEAKELNSNLSIVITDVSGVKVYTKNINNFVQFYSEVIDLKGLATGVYFVNIVNGNTVLNQRILMTK